MDERFLTNEELVRELISAAYDTGYYSGKNEDGQPHHILAIRRREYLSERILLRLSGLDAEALHIDDPGEHFMDDDGRPRGYEEQQWQAEMAMEAKYYAQAALEEEAQVDCEL